MSKAKSAPDPTLPDWWQREKQTRQLRILVFLGLLLALIGYFYYVSNLGVTGGVNSIPRDTANTLVFVRQDKEGGNVPQICTIRFDGTEFHQLTAKDDRSDKSAPSWTLDGKSVLYASNRNDSQKTQIFLLGEGDPRQITYGTGRKDAPVATPNGKSLAFVTQGAIKTVNLNGTEVEQILPPPQAGNSGNGDTPQGEMEVQGPFRRAAFSADGKNLAGVQEISGDQQLGEVESGIVMAGGDQVARVLVGQTDRAQFLETGREVSVAWNPTNNNQLITTFTERHTKAPNGKLALQHGMVLYDFTNGKPVPRPLFVSEGFGAMPENIAWSPDGSTIAFELWRLKGEGERELQGIVVMKVPETPLAIRPEDIAQVCTLRSDQDGQPHSPHWSPDGTALLYQVTRPDQKNDLWIVNADMTNRRNVTNGTGDNTQPAWSPARKN